MAAAAAAYQVEEGHLWKCPQHPTKRRRNGVCPTCLRDRLVTLCQNCGNARPCPCVSATISSSSSSASSSSSSFGGDASFRRSMSLAIPFFRSNAGRVGTPSFLSVFRRNKTKKGGKKNDDDKFESNEKIEDFARMITRSRSVSAASMSGFRRADVSSAAAKGEFWRRMKAFRSSKTPKVIVQDRSPLQRG